MANMSYCMFENTYRDLQDCFEALASKNLDELSESEINEYEKYILLVEQFATNA